jgi:hypothetical protein
LAGNNEKATKRKGNNGNGFKPGQSGNPNGRPKRTEAEKDALEKIRNLAPDVPGLLKSIMQDEKASPAYRLKAAEMILDRAYGKADAALRVEATVQPKGDFVLEIGPGDDDAEDPV